MVETFTKKLTEFLVDILFLYAMLFLSKQSWMKVVNRRKFLFGGIALASISTTSSVAKTTSPKVKEHVSHVQKHVHGPKIAYHKKCHINMSAYDKAILVKTIWGETRGESRLGRMAVVHVILNRMRSDDPVFRSYKSVSEVCLRKFQFSCWLDKLKMRHIKIDDNFHEIKQNVEDAILAYERGIDYSNKAIAYYADSITKIPSWAGYYHKVNKIGHHNFFG